MCDLQPGAPVAEPGETGPKLSISQGMRTMNKIKLLAISTALTASMLLPAMAEARATWT